MFAEIDSVLEGGVITSGLTSTLYTVLSRIPGITVVDGAKNYSGVPGTGFQLSTEFGHTDQATSMIIVDLDNSAYPVIVSARTVSTTPPPSPPVSPTGSASPEADPGVLSLPISSPAPSASHRGSAVSTATGARFVGVDSE